MRPLIGISGSGLSEVPAQTALYDAFFCSPALYSQAVIRAGGTPVIIPPQPGAYERLLERLDGLLMTGGTDLDPVHYDGNRAHPALLPANHDRDISEFALLRQALQRRDFPVLCICRGFQVLNVMLGGSLIEHVPDRGKGDMHRSDDGLWIRHAVDVTPGSGLADTMGAARVETMSGHHQALQRVAPGLSVTATAADGVVEGVELAGHPWCLAVQWHPELTAESDPTQQALFDGLVARAGHNLPMPSDV